MKTRERTHTSTTGAAVTGSGCIRQAGFTIVEVLVAVVVFGVGLLAVAGMQTRSIEQATFSDQMTMRANDVMHWSETLARMPVTDGTVDVGEGSSFTVTASTIFKQGVACEYGATCGWDYITYDEKKPNAVRQRITRGYPLPNLVMIEMEAVPRGVKDTATVQRRTVRTAYVRSLRWN